MNQADVLFVGEEIGQGVLELARRDAPCERFVRLDDALLGRIGGMSRQGQRVVVVLSDPALAAAGARALAADNEFGVIQLLTCDGTSNFL